MKKASYTYHHIWVNNQSVLEELILSLEEKLLLPEIRRSFKELDSMLADDFIELGSSGRIYNKQQVADVLQVLPVSKMIISDFRIKLLAPGIVLAIYNLAQDNRDELSGRSIRSSIWMLQDGTWRIVFHQGTAI